MEHAEGLVHDGPRDSPLYKKGTCLPSRAGLSKPSSPPPVVEVTGST